MGNTLRENTVRDCGDITMHWIYKRHIIYSSPMCEACSYRQQYRDNFLKKAREKL